MRAFLLPAILGDEPQLADFRGKLDGRIQFELLALPDDGAPAALLSSMQQTARVIADEIVRRQPAGAIALMGFSFGASLALEVAAQLTAGQRTVSFLGILDGAFRTNELKRSKAELLRLCLSVDGAMGLARHGFERLKNRQRLLMASWSKSTNTAQTPAVRDAILMDLRCNALNEWQPPSCPAPGIAVCSGALGVANRHRWRSLCPNLDVLTLESRHEDLLKGRSLQLIVDALAERASLGPIHR